ncbi:MAG: ATP-binding cassette domain-containing protein [Treponema sp.]|jgi:phospholipid/cholesterol/gamma-HCH transport system ATP-binding protein|nr:ATP-binding cassette domain-containing protein [Treponema sp.]
MNVPEGNTANAIIRTENLSKAFGENHVLRDVSVTIAEKSLFAVIGQSGTGKSVFFKTLIGMLKPDSGRVWFKNTELTSLKKKEITAFRQRFGYSFQNAALFDSMTVEENLSFPLIEVLGMKNRSKIKKQVTELLEWIELPGIELKWPDELSGGMRKRVGVARALILKPEVLFFDEPTTGLDPVLSETINNLVVRVNKELGITCVLITHDISAAFRITDRIAFLDQGYMIADGTPEELAKSEHPLVKDFIRIAIGGLTK